MKNPLTKLRRCFLYMGFFDADELLDEFSEFIIGQETGKEFSKIDYKEKREEFGKIITNYLHMPPGNVASRMHKRQICRTGDHKYAIVDWVNGILCEYIMGFRGSGLCTFRWRKISPFDDILQHYLSDWSIVFNKDACWYIFEHEIPFLKGFLLNIRPGITKENKEMLEKMFGDVYKV